MDETDDEEFSSLGPFATFCTYADNAHYLATKKAHRARRMSLIEERTANGEMNFSEARYKDRQKLALKRQRESGRFGSDPSGGDDDVGAL